ncbi:MAG: transposase [Firmicutes bacterium]|nr:transposase [Bacillota bacterium]MCL2770834.1 transposase [Bacillota bacterium]
MAYLQPRKQVRLKAFDYCEARFYHVVVCVGGGHAILSKIELEKKSVGAGHLGSPKIKYTSLGEIIEKNIRYTNENLKDRKIVEWVIMPNHIHLIIKIVHPDEIGSPGWSTPTSLPKVVSALKSFIHKEATYKFFQRNYYERIIRNEKELNETRQYIQNNPVNWLTDFYFISK